MQPLNAQLRGGRFLIPVVWVHKGLTPGASFAGAGLEEVPLVGHPILPAPQEGQNK